MCQLEICMNQFTSLPRKDSMILKFLVPPLARGYRLCEIDCSEGHQVQNGHQHHKQPKCDVDDVTCTNNPNVSPTHFVSNIRHQQHSHWLLKNHIGLSWGLEYRHFLEDNSNPAWFHAISELFRPLFDLNC